MLDRVKQALVESYVGAIALGFLLAQTILHLVGVFASPVAGWFTQREYGAMMTRNGVPTRTSLEYALPEVVRFVVLLAIWYGLLRWLYFKPLQPTISEPRTNPEQPA